MANYTATIDINLEAAINGTHEFAYDNESGGPFSYSSSNPTGGENLSWSGGTGKLWHLVDAGTTGYMIISLSSGTAPVNDDTITGSTSSATCDVNGSVTATGPMSSGENLIINSDATVTCTETPSILIGDVAINVGVLLIDGENITSGNMINFVGEYQEEININARGTLEVTGDWYTVGTTDGTDSQTFNLATYYDSSFCVDVVPMIQVETGRRIDYDNASGTTPEQYDWVVASSDDSIMGIIEEVNTGSSYLVVRFLTGSLADDDGIRVVKVVDNNGPDMQVIWTADVNNASGDIKESGVYQEFGNCRANATSYISYYHSGVGGFVFENTFQSTTLTMGSSTGGGFVPPSGCTVRIPNVHFSTSNTTNYASNQTYHDGTTTVANRYNWLTSNGGIADMSVCNMGSVLFSSTLAKSITLAYVGAQIAVGSTDIITYETYSHVVVSADVIGHSTDTRNVWLTSKHLNGGTFSDCLVLASEVGESRVYLTECTGITINRLLMSAPYAAAWHTFTVDPINFNDCKDCTIDNSTLIAGGDNVGSNYGILGSGSGLSITNYRFASAQDGTAQSVIPVGFGIILDSEVIGMTMIDSVPDASIVTLVSHANDVRLRCYGLIDDKPSWGSYGTAAGWVGGYGLKENISLARMYKEGGADTRILTEGGIAKNVEIINCSSGTTGTKYISPFGLDCTVKGQHHTTLIYTSSAVYGRCFYDGFDSSTTGYIMCYNKAASSTVSNYTVSAGDPVFWNNGLMTMYNGDIIIFEQDYYTLGHNAFSGTVTKYAQFGSNPWTNIDVTFQYDLGSGWNGSWLDVDTASNLTGITGMVDGIKLKFKYEASGTQDNMSLIQLDTTTTVALQQANLYPIDQNEVDLTVTVIDKNQDPISGVQTSIHKASDNSELMNEDTNASGIATETFVYSTDTDIIVKCRKSDDLDDPRYIPYSTVGTIISTGFSLTVTLEESLVLN